MIPFHKSLLCEPARTASGTVIPGLDGKQITQSLFWIVRADGWFVLWKNIVNGMTADMKFTRDTPFAITAYSIHVYYWLSFYHSLHFTFAFGLYKGHYTYPMVAQFSTGILAQFSISIYTECHNQSIIVCCHNLSSFPFIHSSRRCLHSFNVGLTQEKSSPSVCR